MVKALERSRELLQPRFGRSRQLISNKRTPDPSGEPKPAQPGVRTSASSFTQLFNPRDLFAAPVVALAASAGGVHALITILAALPGGFLAPILIAQHLSPEHPSKLVSILRRHTALSVQNAHQGGRLLAGHAYVTPSGRHLEVCPDETLSLPLAAAIGLGRPSADLLFTTLAQNVGRRAVAVVLTGFGRDGSRGVQAVRAAGGINIAQDEASSQFAGMPRSAIETGCVDFVLPLTEIAQKLIILTHKFSECAVCR